MYTQHVCGLMRYRTRRKKSKLGDYIAIIVGFTTIFPSLKPNNITTLSSGPKALVTLTKGNVHRQLRTPRMLSGSVCSVRCVGLVSHIRKSGGNVDYRADDKIDVTQSITLA